MGHDTSTWSMSWGGGTSDAVAQAVFRTPARWAAAIRRVSVRTLLVAGTACAPAAAAPGPYALALDAAVPPIVPGYVPVALLLALEAAAVLASVLVSGRRRLDASDALLLCSRCARLHKRTEAFARAADALAVGALAFLVALPFVTAGYESGFTLVRTVLAASAVVAVIAVAAEADFLARALAASVWPRLAWRAEPARIVGGGARWLGAILALVLFQPRGAGIVALFGGVGERLIVDLASTWTILAAATILLFAAIVSLLARWLVPLVYGSLPTALAARRREPHGTSV